MPLQLFIVQKGMSHRIEGVARYIEVIGNHVGITFRSCSECFGALRLVLHKTLKHVLLLRHDHKEGIVMFFQVNGK